MGDLKEFRDKFRTHLDAIDRSVEGGRPLMDEDTFREHLLVQIGVARIEARKWAKLNQLIRHQAAERLVRVLEDALRLSRYPHGRL